MKFWFPLLAAVGAIARNSSNMNADQPYLVANALPGYESRSATYKGEYFLVYSPPIRSQYSQVFWNSMTPVPLPKEIVKRFANSTVAITGWEVDVVRRANASAILLDPHFDDGQDVSVPCYESYNHHYGANIKGKGLHMLDTKGLFPSHGASGDQVTFVRDSSFVPKLMASGEPIPGVQSFNEHNGNEARQSFHGLPVFDGKQTVQLIYGPETFIMSPMQINTKNPDHSVWPGPRGGPLPRASSAPPNASYSGILECPCTSRITKELSGHVTVAEGRCNFEAGVTTAQECFEAAKNVGLDPVIANVTTPFNASAPAGCYAVREMLGFRVIFNGHATKPSECVFEADTDYNHGAQVPSAQATSKEECCSLCRDRALCAGATFYDGVCYFKSASDFEPSKRKPFQGATACRANKSHHNYMSTSSITTVQPGGECGVEGDAGAVAGEMQAAASTVALSLKFGDENVTMTLSGPDGVWFAVGLNASMMIDQPYAIVVDGHGTVTERQLGVAGSQNGHDPGKLLTPSVEVVHQSVQAGRRSVTLTRSQKGASQDHFSFPQALVHTGGAVPVISAHGNTVTIAQHPHDAFSSSTLTLARAGVSTCICRGGAGKINGVPFNPRCYPYPKSSMLPQHNPTCDVSTYVGGLACCKNTFLLDADQQVPAPVDTVYFKWRFYFLDFDERVQLPTIHLEWQLGHIEYDIPQAPAGTPPEAMIHELSSAFTTRDMMMYSHPGCDPVTEPYCADSNKVTDKGIALIMAGGHCHAPACLSLELYNADTGALLCRIIPTHGSSDQSKNENGYLWLPPCVWGDQADGLTPPPVLHMDTNFTSIKRTNSSVYHYGVMAIWQMRGLYL